MGVNKTFVLHNETNAKALWAFLKANWKSMADQGRALAVLIVEHKSKRSLEQNKRYWAILRDISRQSWVRGKQFNEDAWHELFKRQFSGMDELPNGDMAGISTTTLNVKEFTDYMEEVERYAIEDLGVQFDG
jgi:hypothetical protein